MQPSHEKMLRKKLELHSDIKLAAADILIAEKGLGMVTSFGKINSKGLFCGYMAI